ncbi:MAG: cation:proton antiporter [Gammaproteobacteria bacterium]
MPHDFPLIATLAAAFGFALVMGFVAVKLKQPALLGYLVAGILIGPATPGYVADIALSKQLAEIGVMLLMFGVGLHFSVDDLLAVRRVAVTGAIVQMMVATLLGAAVALWWGWGLGAGLVFGLSLSVASTVVMLRALESRGQLETPNGRLAVGWLVVEDLAMVMALVLLPAIAGWLAQSSGPTGTTAADGGQLGLALASTFGKVALFVVLMFAVGRRVFPWLLWQVARTGSRELFTLCVIAAAVGIAFGAAEVFGVSFALGAFLAGMILRESSFSQRAASESMPLRDAFSVLFFVSVGMLFDPAMLTEEPLRLLAVVAIVVVGKTVAALLIVLAFRHPPGTALTVSASLAQIGEFSFILASLGVSLQLLPAEGQSLILAAALVSIALNPLLFNAQAPLEKWLGKHPWLAGRGAPSDLESGAASPPVEAVVPPPQVLLVGYGRVGRRIAEVLTAEQRPFMVVERDQQLVDQLRQQAVPVLQGDAADPEVLAECRIATTAVLVLATNDLLRARRIMEAARTLHPGIPIVLRVHDETEHAVLRENALVDALMGEHELAHAMASRVLKLTTATEPAVVR